MNCPRCDTPLEDPQARFCPLCGASITSPPGATVSEPTSKPVAPGAGTYPPSGPPPGAETAPAGPGTAAGGSSAHCAAHPERAAVDICSRCGSFACRECLIVGADGQGICSACHTRQGGDTAPLPWERRKELGFFNAYWQTTKSIMFNPNTAFDRMIPETGQWWDPLSYAIFSNFLALSGTMVMYAFIFGIAGIAALAQSGGTNDLGAGVTAGIIVAIVLALLIMIPLGAIMVAFIGGGIEHLALKLLGANPRPFEATLRAYCYAHAPMFWGVVPLCGAYAYPIWQIVCRIFGYKSVHRITGGQAAAGVLVPVGVFCLCFGGIYGIAIAAAMAAGN
ncbi:MAG: YIP1 family protein [Deltaproteobacteria bacterium]|nr:YIP1 family protein [Deltaproteobacteria bacterium]